MPVNLFNANDGLTGRDGGPYLDLEQAKEAEIRRAKIEDREPDLDNPPANAGIQLLTAGQVFANNGVNNLPSQDGKGNVNAEVALQAIADSDNALVVSATVPDVLFEEPEDKKDEVKDKTEVDDDDVFGESNIGVDEEPKAEVVNEPDADFSSEKGITSPDPQPSLDPQTEAKYEPKHTEPNPLSNV